MEVIDGQRAQLERELTQALFRGDRATFNRLRVQLARRATLTLHRSQLALESAEPSQRLVNRPKR